MLDDAVLACLRLRIAEGFDADDVGGTRPGWLTRVLINFSLGYTTMSNVNNNDSHLQQLINCCSGKGWLAPVTSNMSTI
jgi:hypothetical protein